MSEQRSSKQQIDSLVRRVNALIPASVTPETRIAIHPCDWLILVDELKERAAPEPGDALRQAIQLLRDCDISGIKSHPTDVRVAEFIRKHSGTKQACSQCADKRYTADGLPCTECNAMAESPGEPSDAATVTTMQIIGVMEKALRQIDDYSAGSTIQPVLIARDALRKLYGQNFRTEARAPEPPAASQAWMVWYEDNVVSPEVFIGNGAEQAAKRRYQQARDHWSCHLFARVEDEHRLPPTKPARPLTLGGLVLQTARGDVKERTLSPEEVEQLKRSQSGASVETKASQFCDCEIPTKFMPGAHVCAVCGKQL